MKNLLLSFFLLATTVFYSNTITLASSTGTNNQTVCEATAITNIYYSTTGTISATFTGLPNGVTGTYLSGNILISGTPTIAGTYNYTISTIGGGSVATATGTITVLSNNTITLISSVGTNNQSVCIGTPITNIQYATTGCTGAIVTGLPTGLTASWSANIVTITGNTMSSCNYVVTLTGGCGVVTATGTITVVLNNTIALASATGTNNQAICSTAPITNIYYDTTGATGCAITGLPAGVTGSFVSGNIAILGTPTAQGIYNYTITLTGGCGMITATGTIVVTPTSTPIFSFSTAMSIGGIAPLLPTISDNGFSGNWSPSIIDNINSGNYVFTPNAGQCATTTTISMVVNRIAAPTGNTAQSFTINGTIGDIAVTGTNVVWYASEADAAANINPLHPSTVLINGNSYYARQTVNGYRSTTSLVVTVNTTLLSNIGFDQTAFQFYPNPTVDFVKLSYSENLTAVKVSNLLGQQLFFKNINNNTTQIDLSNFQSGTYFIEVISNYVSKIIKVVKQ